MIMKDLNKISDNKFNRKLKINSNINLNLQKTDLKGERWKFWRSFPQNWFVEW